MPEIYPSTAEYKIGNTTYIVHRFSRAGATETLDELLRRNILAEANRRWPVSKSDSEEP
jgi:hypothetical protein